MNPSPALKAIRQGQREGRKIKILGAFIARDSQRYSASATKSRIIENCRKRIDKQRGHGRRHAGFNQKWDALSPAEQAMLGLCKRQGV